MADSKHPVLVHYHIFKNAGTSVDRMLEESFGERWYSWDYTDPNARIPPAALERFILDHEDAIAVSSHQAVPPLPNAQIDVYPIVFLRHPIDRAYSAYLFEWGKQKNLPVPQRSFAEYIAESFRNRRRNAIEDMQTIHLANRGRDTWRPDDSQSDEDILAAARDFLHTCPFFGLVDQYEASIALMRQRYAPVFPALTCKVYQDNALRDVSEPLSARLERIRAQLPAEAYAELILRNQMDLRLYEYALGRFEVLQEGGRGG